MCFSGTHFSSVSGLTILVNGRYRFDAIIAQRREDLDERVFVGTHAGKCMVQFLGVQFGKGRHQRADDFLEVTGKLRFQLGNEVLAVHCFKFVCNFQSLYDTSMSQDVDDGLLIGTEALHGGSQKAGVLLGIERFGRIHGRRALGEFKVLSLGGKALLRRGRVFVPRLISL